MTNNFISLLWWGGGGGGGIQLKKSDSFFGGCSTIKETSQFSGRLHKSMQSRVSLPCYQYTYANVEISVSKYHIAHVTIGGEKKKREKIRKVPMPLSLYDTYKSPKDIDKCMRFYISVLNPTHHCLSRIPI